MLAPPLAPIRSTPVLSHGVGIARFTDWWRSGGLLPGARRLRPGSGDGCGPLGARHGCLHVRRLTRSFDLGLRPQAWAARISPIVVSLADVAAQQPNGPAAGW